MLRNVGKSLENYEPMSTARIDASNQKVNNLIAREMSNNKHYLLNELEHMLQKLTEEQHTVYETIMTAVDSAKGRVFFVYGYGGIGKTFLWKALSSSIRSRSEIVSNVASNGIASLLFSGGRTAHSRFAILFGVKENTTGNIVQGTELAELIIKCKLIIWDEALMMHIHCFEALDKSLKDVMQLKDTLNKTTPFGGKIVVFGGDFKQILHIVPKGTRQDVVRATINSSEIWNYCTIPRLTKNMRLMNSASDSESEELKEFSSRVASIGDGTIGGPHHGSPKINTPDDILLKFHDENRGYCPEHLPRFL